MYEDDSDILADSDSPTVNSVEQMETNGETPEMVSSQLPASDTIDLTSSASECVSHTVTALIKTYHS